MANDDASKKTKPIKKKGLPPISPRENEDFDTEKQVKRKPKKKVLKTNEDADVKTESEVGRQ